MDKSALLSRITAVRRELDALTDIVLSMEDVQPQPSVQQEPDDWMTAKQVCKRLNIGTTTFYEGIRNGTLPPGFAFGPKTKRWRMSDIRSWQASRQTSDERERQTAHKRRGRPSRIRKIGVLCRV